MMYNDPMMKNLAEAALKFSIDEYPELDVGQYLNRLDAYADVIRTRLPNNASPIEIVDKINHYLFEELGFSGNLDDYYDPRNSYLNDVLDRRLGIPITLSLIFISIGDRLGLDIKGVSFPGHFLVKCRLERNHFVIVDPFSGGKYLDRDDLESRLVQIYGQHPSIQETLDELLKGASETEFLHRMLNNLKAIYLSNENFEKALFVVDRIVRLRPDRPDEVRDRGKIYLALQNYSSAKRDLQYYLKQSPDAEDYDEVRENLVELYSSATGAVH